MAVDEHSRGADEAFRRHVVPELAVLLRVARRLAGDATTAEDLVQETLLRAYRAVDRFDGRYPRAWLLTIMRNTWRNMHRRTRPQLLRDGDAIAAVAVEGSHDDMPEQVVEQMLDPDLAAGLRALSDDHRAVVLLVDVDGLTYRQAAEVLGVPAGTVMSRLHRARARLRRRLERSGSRLAGRR